ERGDLAEVLLQISQNDQQNLTRIFLLNNSIADYFTTVEYTMNLQDSLRGSLDRLKTEKQDIVGQKQSLEKKQQQLSDLKSNLSLQQQELQGQVIYKKNLLAKTQQSENKFNQLYTQALKEQSAISAQITALEKQARASSGSQALRDSVLIWPVPQNTITTYFHDPDYPFRYVYEHPAVDIRAKQGTAVHAATEGYVLTAKDAGMGYSYIAIIHANGLSTVYGHVSKIYVSPDQYVAKGAIIGLSGGMPGTPGAGPLTTGPHLHFEVRLNGIPVNALNYLP
ncbi:MAG: peptidoglycan DD-metalloendopeptidase family protein, partial [Parcubacteria group bacterium]